MKFDEERVRMALIWGFIACAVQSPISIYFLWQFVREQENAADTLAFYLKIFGYMPWFVILRAPFQAVSVFFSEQYGLRMGILFLFSLTNINWFLNGFLLGLVFNIRDDSDKYKPGSPGF